MSVALTSGNLGKFLHNHQLLSEDEKSFMRRSSLMSVLDLPTLSESLISLHFFYPCNLPL